MEKSSIFGNPNSTVKENKSNHNKTASNSFWIEHEVLFIHFLFFLGMSPYFGPKKICQTFWNSSYEIISKSLQVNQFYRDNF